MEIEIHARNKKINGLVGGHLLMGLGRPGACLPPP